MHIYIYIHTQEQGNILAQALLASSPVLKLLRSRQNKQSITSRSLFSTTDVIGLDTQSDRYLGEEEEENDQTTVENVVARVMSNKKAQQQRPYSAPGAYSHNVTKQSDQNLSLRDKKKDIGVQWVEPCKEARVPAEDEWMHAARYGELDWRDSHMDVCAEKKVCVYV